MNLLYKNIDFFFQQKRNWQIIFLQTMTLISYFESIYSLLNPILLYNIWKILNVYQQHKVIYPQQHQIVLVDHSILIFHNWGLNKGCTENDFPIRYAHAQYWISNMSSNSLNTVYIIIKIRFYHWSHSHSNSAYTNLRCDSLPIRD